MNQGEGMVRDEDKSCYLTKYL